MNQITAFTDKIYFTLESILNNFNSINHLLVKSDDENLEKLLEDPKDKVKFQKAIDELMKDSEKIKEINLNGKNIKISI